MRIALYPGSFDPPTLGHLDIIERAAKVFDRLIVAVGRNPSKTGFLTVEERAEVLKKCTGGISNVEVDTFEGLLVEYAAKQGASVIIRGLRATQDFEYEFQMALVNRRLSAEVETVFLVTKWDYSYLSSSMVREVAQLGGQYENLVPTPVAEVIRDALKRT